MKYLLSKHYNYDVFAPIGQVFFEKTDAGIEPPPVDKWGMEVVQYIGILPFLARRNCHKHFVFL
jgi:hypothetical protein